MSKFSGTIIFSIWAAKNLPDTDSAFFNIADHFGEKDLTDPLVSIEIDGKEKFRTHHINNTLNPIWETNNKYEYQAEGRINEILIRVKDKELIGSVNVGAKIFDPDAVRGLEKDKKIDGWFELRSNDGKGEYLPEAKIKLTIEYKSGQYTVEEGNYITEKFYHI